MSKTKKSEATKANVTENALALFRENGFENTTMRLIAQKAGIAPGTIYIYYASKEEIVLEHYNRTQGALYEKVLAELPDATAKKSKELRLADALKFLFTEQLEALQDDRLFLSGLARAAVDAGNPVSPFSQASEHVRKAHLDIFRKIIERSGEKIDPVLKEELPGLLWMIQMGLIFFWLHDKSENSENTTELIDTVMELMTAMIKLHNNPLASSFKKNLIRLARGLMRIVP